MRAYNTEAVPATLQASSLSGAGRGGGTTEALTMGREAAYAPLAQQEVLNRMTAIPEYQNIANLKNQFALTGLSATDLPRQIQQQGFQSAFQDLMRRYNLEQQATLGPLQQMGPNLFGETSVNTSSQDPFTNFGFPLIQSLF